MEIEVHIDPIDLKVRTPFRLIIVGPTQCGKSSLVLKFLACRKHLVHGPEFTSIVWAFGEGASLTQQFRAALQSPEIGGGVAVRLQRGLPDFSTLENGSLLVIDDLLQSALSSPEFLNFCIRTSHHQAISLLFISQNLFFQSKLARTISLSMNYLILFQFLRDSVPYLVLSRQIYPKKPGELYRILNEHFESGVYKHLLIDLHVECNPLTRFRYYPALSEETNLKVGSCDEHVELFVSPALLEEKVFQS